MSSGDGVGPKPGAIRGARHFVTLGVETVRRFRPRLRRARKNLAAAFGRHACAETVGLLPIAVPRLIRALHGTRKPLRGRNVLQGRPRRVRNPPRSVKAWSRSRFRRPGRAAIRSTQGRRLPITPGSTRPRESALRRARIRLEPACHQRSRAHSGSTPTFAICRRARRLRRAGSSSSPAPSAYAVSYPRDNPTAVQIREQLLEQLNQATDAHGTWRLRITPSEIWLVDEPIVHPPLNADLQDPLSAKADRLPYIFYRDGVRGVVFQPAVPVSEFRSVLPGHGRRRPWAGAPRRPGDSALAGHAGAHPGRRGADLSDHLSLFEEDPSHSRRAGTRAGVQLVAERRRDPLRHRSDRRDGAGPASRHLRRLAAPQRPTSTSPPPTRFSPRACSSCARCCSPNGPPSAPWNGRRTCRSCSAACSSWIPAPTRAPRCPNRW